MPTLSELLDAQSDEPTWNDSKARDAVTVKITFAVVSTFSQVQISRQVRVTPGGAEWDTPRVAPRDETGLAVVKLRPGTYNIEWGALGYPPRKAYDVSIEVEGQPKWTPAPPDESSRRGVIRNGRIVTV